MGCYSMFRKNIKGRMAGIVQEFEHEERKQCLWVLRTEYAPGFVKPIRCDDSAVEGDTLCDRHIAERDEQDEN